MKSGGMAARMCAPPGLNRRRRIMSWTVPHAMNRTNGPRATGGAHYVAQAHGATVARKMIGLAIVTSGLAVIAAQALQHAFGG
jgi:hypothetical protein